MKILKINDAAMFSVENLYLLVALSQKVNAKNKNVVVVSAREEINELLLEAAQLASLQNSLYKEKLKRVEKEYLQSVKELIPLVGQSGVLSRVKKMCNDLEDLCEGVFLVSELSSKVADRIRSYGELLSSYVLSAKLQSLEIENKWLDARDLVQSNFNLGLSSLSFSETGDVIRDAVNNSDEHLFVLPDIKVAYHRFSDIVSQSFNVEALELLSEEDERCLMSA